LKTPVPAYEYPLCRGCVSPVPTQTMSGSDAETATSPIVKVDSFSKMGFQVRPLLTVFQRFPDPTPT
jgi:hypothetical protein